MGEIVIEIYKNKDDFLRHFCERVEYLWNKLRTQSKDKEFLEMCKYTFNFDFPKINENSNFRVSIRRSKVMVYLENGKEWNDEFIGIYKGRNLVAGARGIGLIVWARLWQK